MTKAQPSKSDQIRKLLYLPNAEIVRRTGFSHGLVATVRGRTDESGKPKRRPCDANYDALVMERYPTDPALRLRLCQATKRWRERNAEKVRAAGRARKARAS
jgi:hypothetical protein